MPAGGSPEGGQPIGIALVGAAAIAMVGAGVLAAGRERRRNQEEQQPIAEEVAEVLDRRSLRQGKVRLESDPIVDALGIDGGPDRPVDDG